jgi:hypothetical protein
MRLYIAGKFVVKNVKYEFNVALMQATRRRQTDVSDERSQLRLYGRTRTTDTSDGQLV